MNRTIRTLGLLAMVLILLCTGIGGYFLISHAQQNAATQIKMASSRDFLFASHPQCMTNDSILITAHLYRNGQPVNKAGIPVNFTLSDGRFATLDNSTVNTDDWGTASTYLRSYASGELMPTHPFLLNVTANAEGVSSLLTVKVTRFITQNGTVTYKYGNTVNGAVVSLVYADTGKPVNAPGSTTVTNPFGKYTLDKVPTDIGNLEIYVKRGDLVTHMPASFSALQDIKF